MNTCPPRPSTAATTPLDGNSKTASDHESTTDNDVNLKTATVSNISSSSKPDKLANQLESLSIAPKLNKTANCNHSNNNNNIRTRSYSENVTAKRAHLVSETDLDETNNTSKFSLTPLDLSFETGDSSFWSEGEPGSSIQSPTDYELVGDDGFTDEALDDDENRNGIPSSNDKDTFRKSFASATSMVFHRHTGLPLTSSPAPLRKASKGKFEFDDSLTSPNNIKRALFQSRKATPVSPIKKVNKRGQKKILSVSAPASVLTASNLLGTFEESVLNGRLEPHSTVEGFTAEIGASGSFQPKHMTVPVTVFFYTLCDNTTISSPYLGHINLGKKGYRVPNKGTLQVTLFNPLGTVVKMFVVMYDLSDMPPTPRPSSGSGPCTCHLTSTRARSTRTLKSGLDTSFTSGNNKIHGSLFNTCCEFDDHHIYSKIIISHI